MTYQTPESVVSAHYPDAESMEPEAYLVTSDDIRTAGGQRVFTLAQTMEENGTVLGESWIVDGQRVWLTLQWHGGYRVADSFEASLYDLVVQRIEC